MSASTQTPHRLLTAADLLAMPKGMELARGELVGETKLYMGNNPRHAWVETRLGRLLDAFTETHGQSVTLTECGFILAQSPDTVRVPDIATVSRARYDIAQATDGYFQGAPDLAIEILSPGNSSEEIDLKITEYFEAGVQEVWTVSVKRRGVTVYRASGEWKFYRRADTLDGGAVLPGFALPLIELFPD